MALNSGYSYREQVGVPSRGQDVLAYLTARHRHATEDAWRERIARGEVEVDGVHAEVGIALRPGQILVWHRPPWDEPEVPSSYELIYEDEALLAVVKPRGLPTMPGGGFLNRTLLALVRERFPEASPMHRLGRETSGLVLFARGHEASAALQAAWRSHRVEKHYRALASGVAALDSFDITAPIGPVAHPLLGTLHAARPDGKASRSRARVLERRPESTLFEVEIDTGRPHQIRIHLAFAGHPLVGDPLYASGGLPRTDVTALPGDPGYLLHAERLAFRHPLSGQPLELRAPAPAELLTASESQSLR